MSIIFSLGEFGGYNILPQLELLCSKENDRDIKLSIIEILAKHEFINTAELFSEIYNNESNSNAKFDVLKTFTDRCGKKPIKFYKELFESKATNNSLRLEMIEYVIDRKFYDIAITFSNFLKNNEKDTKFKKDFSKMQILLENI